MGKNIITKIEVQKRNKNRVNVYVDEEFLFACSTEIVYVHKLKSGEQIDVKHMEEIIREDDYIKCKNAALRSIEKAYKTQKQVYDKLIGKGYEEKTIEKTIDFLKEYNLLDDYKFADMYIKDKIKIEGRNKIKYSLIRKGIKDSIIEEKLNNLDSENERETALKIGEKKYNQIVKREEDTRKVYKKLADFLVRKGYSWDDAKHVANHFVKGQ